MKKIASLAIIGVLLLSGLGAVALPNIKESEQSMKCVSISFSTLETLEKDEYQLITMGNTNSWYNTPHFPMLPAYIETFTFPFGTKITNVEVTFSDVSEQILTKQVLPGSEPVILLSENNQNAPLVKDEAIYSSSELYPKTNFYYTTNAGIADHEHVVFLTVKCYPVHYNPAANTLYYSDSLSINILYETPTNSMAISEEYDLVIIAPEKFTSNLQTLVNHKNSIGMSTLFKTVEDIYTEYSGRDQPEQIKYFIKYAFDTYGIEYVLLVGGLKSMIYADRRDDANQGSKAWYVPVRYTNLYDGGSVQDPGYISDLYYADLYDGDGNFSSWDSNDDDIFAAWGKYGVPTDQIDLFPDLYVGRLACRNKIEVNTMVKKIINYESGTDPSWFEKMVVIGGDTFDDVGGYNYYEGEVENQKSLDYMDGFEPVKIWCSNRDTGDLVPIPRHIIPTVSKGCGFLAFAGHGSPERWNTHWPEEFGEDDERVKGLWWWNMPFFYNGKKLPICVVGGCHNSQFNVTATTFLFDALWVYGPVPECFSWLLTKKIGGGSIATMGNTGLGYGKVGNSGDLDGDGIDDPDCVEGLGGYLETQFFKAYGVNGYDILGETWGQAITQYLTTYPGMTYKLDCKTVQQWALLGDPSLKIGGYTD